MTICGVAMRRSRIRSYTALVDCGNKHVRAHSALGQEPAPHHPRLRQLTWKVPRLSSKSASMDHTFSDLYTRFCTGSEPSKYSARRAGKAVAFCGKREEALRGCPGPTTHPQLVFASLLEAALRPRRNSHAGAPVPHTDTTHLPGRPPA